MKTVEKSLALLASLSLLVGARAAEPAAAPVRLAIVAQTPTEPAGDVLTAEFSQDKQVQLLERTELQKVYREQGLTAAGHADYIKLGQLLRADGILTLEQITTGGAEWLEARLLAVKQGVVLGTLRLPSPVEQDGSWAGGLVKHFQPLLPKLTVQAGDAVPLSVVNLHSATRSAQGEQTERQLTLLTIERLTRERNLFVLERGRLELLSAEKELQPGDESPFWNGKYVLDGVVDRDGYSAETVTLNARLTPPKGGAPVELALRSSRTNLTALIEQLAGQIHSALKLTQTNAAWNPQEEAARYAEEARWAFQWKMYPEAAAAAEASWALGYQKLEVAELRIRAYSESGADDVALQIDNEHKLVGFAAAAHPAPGQFIMPTRPEFGSSLPPDSAKFPIIRRAMENYCRDFRVFIAPQVDPGWTWCDLGLEVLDRASVWLRHYYYVTEARAGKEENITAVRELAREMAAIIGSHKAFANPYRRSDYHFARSNYGLEMAQKPWLGVRTLGVVKATWGGLWAETPEEGARYYQALLESGDWPKARLVFITREFTEVPVKLLSSSGTMTSGSLDPRGPISFLNGWKWEDRKRAPAVWHRFIDELCASQKPDVKLEGLFLRCAQAPTDEEHDRAFGELLAFVKEHVGEIMTPQRDDDLAADIEGLLQSRARNQDEQAALAARTAAWNQIKPQVVEYRARFERDFRLEARKPDQVAGAAPQATQPPRVGTPFQPPMAIHPPLGGGQGPRPIIPGSPPQGGSPFPMPGQVGPRGPRMAGTDPATLAITNTLEVTRFWPLPQRLDPSNGPVTLNIVNGCFRDGRLWVETRYDRIGTFAGQETFFNRGAIFALDLDTFQSETIPLDGHLFTLSRRDFAREVDRMFEVYSGYLYVSSADTLKRYSLKTKTWEDLPVPVHGHARFSIIGNRLLVGTEDSIFEVSGEGKEARLLASSRRRPAQNALDQAEDYGCPPMLAGPGGSLLAVVRGNIYELGADQKDWTAGPSPTASLTQPRYLIFDDGLLISSSPGMGVGKMFGLFKESRSPELLLVQNAGAPFGPGPRPQPAANEPKPLWPLPENVAAVDYPVCLDGRALWVLAGTLASRQPGPYVPPAQQPQSSSLRRLVLFRLEPGRSQPFELALNFASTGARPRPGFQMRDQVTFLTTPRGLVVASSFIPGVWLIPLDELKQRVQDWRKSNPVKTEASNNEGGAPPSTR